MTFLKSTDSLTHPV